MPALQEIREVVEKQQYDDIAFWKNHKLLAAKAKLGDGAELHGSALVIHNRGIMVSGKSESGKTTTWFNLLRAGGRAISEDLTNLVFVNGKPLLVSPATRHAFRIHGKFHRLHTSKPAHGVVGKMKSGASIPRYTEAPMDAVAQANGRPLRAVFYLEKQRLHPRAYPRIVLMGEKTLVGHLQSEDTSTFPSLFHLPETHSRESIRRLTWKRKEEIAKQLVRSLKKSGVHFFQVYIPETRDKSRQVWAAQAISRFTRRFAGGFKPGLNLIAINRQHAGQVFPITRRTVVGRQADVKISGDDRIASHHALLEQRGGKWTARDLGTKAHTHILKKSRIERGKVDWRRLKGAVEIENGDLLAIGRTFFQVVIQK